MASHKKYLKALRLLGSKHPGDHRCRHVAVIYENKVPVAIGYNRAKTHPLQLRYSQNQNKLHLHAEIDAIAKCPRTTDFSRCDLFVGRISGESIKESCPCKSCWSAIEAFGFRSVIWTTSDGQCHTHSFT